MSRERYGIIVCPDCQNARSVDLSNKTASCNYCGNKMKIKKMNIYYQTNSQKEAVWAVQRLNEKLRGKEIPRKKNEPSDPYYMAIKKSDEGENKREKLLIMARVLTRELGEFGREDLEEISEKGDLGDADTMIEDIRKIDEVYEPEPEIFKSI
ncbi:MAG: DUF1922 domain-containing protein [Candidatus Saliniplasma sp.]